MTEEEKISLLIPAYLRGELTESERQYVEKHAADNPDVAADIGFQKNLKSALFPDQDDFTADEAGWARLSKAMDSDSDLDVKTTPNYWRYAAAILAVCTVAQGGLLSTKVLDEDRDAQAAQYVTVSEAPETAISAKFGFKSDAMTADLTRSLQAVDGTVVDGPSSLGLYTVGFKSEKACLMAVDRLAMKPSIVETVSACE